MSKLPEIRSAIVKSRRWTCRAIPPYVIFYASVSLLRNEDGYLCGYESRNLTFGKGEIKDLLDAWASSSFTVTQFDGEYWTQFTFHGKADLPTLKMFLSRDTKHIRVHLDGHIYEGQIAGAFPSWVKGFLNKRLF